MAQYTYTGYDASAHVAEETKNASVEAPKGMVRSVWVSILAGWVLLVAVTAAIQDYEGERNSATGLPPAQIFIDARGRHTRQFLLFICAVAQFFCGMASVTANSRMSYRLRRDGALPGSRLWAKVNPRTGTPTNSIWLCVTCSLVLALPALKSLVAYFAVTSIAVIGLYIAYVVPVFLRRRNPDFRTGDLEPGPVERADRLDRRRLGHLHRHPLHAPGLRAGHRRHVQLRAGRRPGGAAVRDRSRGSCGGRQHFMRDVPEGHDTRPPTEIFGS